MSFKAAAWAIQQAPRTAHEKLLLIVLADYHNEETGQCNPSLTRLAERALCARNTVTRALASLEEQGFLIRRRGTYERSTQYDLKIGQVHTGTRSTQELGPERCRVGPQECKGRSSGVPEPVSEPRKEPVSKRFIPPTVEQVKKYCQSRDNRINASHFVDFYSSKGWMVGKNKMKDWEAAVRTWERNQENSNGKPTLEERLNDTSWMDG